jgi:type I restriction enzyme S subunit
MNHSWEKAPIKTIYKGFWDGPHATPKKAEYGPIFLGIKNMTEDGHLDFSSIRHISEEDYPKWTKRVVPQAGDIVFTYEASLHRYAILPQGFRGSLGRRVALIRPDERKINSRYLLYYFLGKEWRKEISKYMILGATVDRIPLIEFPEFRIHLPPLPTQRKIAAILSAYDDLIENNTRRIQILEQMAQAIYRQWFVEFKFPGHEDVLLVDSGTELGEIPEGWEVKILADFGDVITGKTPSKKVEEYWNSPDVQFIRTPDMHDQFYCIQTTDYLSRRGAESQHNKYLPPNSLCVSCIGTVGIVIVTAFRAQTNQQINSIVLTYQYDLEFLYFRILDLKNTIQLYGSTGATMANLSRGKFISLKLITPSRKYRTKYHEVASPMFEEIKNLQLKNTNLRATRDLLLPRLVSGELDVSELVICINMDG